MNDLTPEEVEALSKAINFPEPAPAGSTPAAASMNQAASAASASAASAASAAPAAPPLETAQQTLRVSRAQFVQLEEIAEAAEVEPKDLERLYDIKVKVEVILGSTRMPLENILKLHPGSVVELNKLAGEAVDILANGKLIAKAEVVVIEENFGIKVLEIIGAKQKLSLAAR
ncbi:MAG: chemotaxis protein CheC [Chlamydiales bacterium]|jgi:flagellar motor switch protein FliN/FliY|nr:chemotaxis protein CheC [Chlamydiales bacterium]